MSLKLPGGWTSKSFGELFEFKNGFNADKTMYGKGKKFINIMEIINNQSLYEKDVPGKVDMTPEHFALYSVVKGDVLFNRTSETHDEIGLTAVYLDDEPVTFGGFVIRARPIGEELDQDFCKYCFSANNIRKEIIKRGQGAIRSNIGQGDLSDVCIQIPPKKEQEKIAKILSGWDKAIAILEKQTNRMEFRFEWFLSDLLSSQKSKNKKQTWKTYKLNQLAKFINGRGFKQSEWSSTGLPIIRIQNLNGGTEFNHYDGEYDQRHYINTGDLLFSWSGNRGTSFGPKIWSGIPGLLNQHIFKVENTALISKEFLYLVLKYATRIIESKAHGGSGLVHVTKSELEKFDVELPGSSAEFIVMSNLLLSKESELRLLKKKLNLLKTQKQGLMQQLLTGKKRVKV